MTIYWERCGLCMKHKPARQCSMEPALMVCASCCVICPRRSTCPRPVWLRELGVVKPVEARAEPSEREKILEELLSRLG